MQNGFSEDIDSIIKHWNVKSSAILSLRAAINLYLNT
jgi:hypothetical protein